MRYGPQLLIQDYMEYPEKLVVRACLECGSLVLDQAAHDVHHSSDSNRDRIRQLEAERTAPSRLS